MATSYPRPGPAGQGLRVHYTDARPEHAYIAVEYRDGWFYIDERDLATKRYFKLLGGLWSSTIADAAGKTSTAPILRFRPAAKKVPDQRPVCWPAFPVPPPE